ncbi:hypothetical protein GCM10009557_65700 [Virgisporangium ochraceum]|uniref:NmrA family protein n=1 Tax=Virgisporangium ochraceum TaxID=65505 RepID=A0A8J4A208_9ACTN|nr:hypothetical protein [Virgisporangium ochraceum]GIJ73726.1 hypothetical protein Voc01_086430 [Virgisporangium ochraceum]
MFLYAHPSTAADVAAAAAAAGVEHLVVLSSNAVARVDDPEVNPMAAPFVATEAALTAGPVLRPGAFAGNARQWTHDIRTRRAADLPYPDARVDAVTEGDVAEVAFRTLTDPGLWGATLDLTGPRAIGLAEQVRVIAAALGAEVAVRRVGRDRWKRSVGPYLTDAYAEALLNYWRDLERHPAPVSTDVPTVIGRPATGFADWVTQHIDEFR